MEYKSLFNMSNKKLNQPQVELVQGEALEEDKMDIKNIIEEIYVKWHDIHSPDAMIRTILNFIL